MNKIEFNKLEVIEQIKYINEKLLEGNTLTNLCKSIGVGRSTIRDRFKKVSYEYNKINNQYESIVEILEPIGSVLPVASNGTKEDEEYEEYEEKVIIQESSKKVVGTELYKNNEVLINMINSYDENLNKLNEIYEWYKSQSSREVVEIKTKMDIPDYDEEIVVRSFKLYSSTQQRFAEFCKKNNKYKVQDILCYLLNKGMDEFE